MKSLKKTICLITALMCGIMFGLFALTACGEEEEPPYEPPKNCDVVLEQKGYDGGGRNTARLSKCVIRIARYAKSSKIMDWNLGTTIKFVNMPMNMLKINLL